MCEREHVCVRVRERERGTVNVFGTFQTSARWRETERQRSQEKEKKEEDDDDEEVKEPL